MPIQKFALPPSADDITPALKEALNGSGAVVFENCSLTKYFFSNEQGQRIRHLFPTIRGVLQFPPLLIIRVKELPPQPWPCAIANMPLYITTTDAKFPIGYDGLRPLFQAGGPSTLERYGFDHGRPAGGSPILETYQDDIDANLEMIISQAYDSYHSSMGISPIEVSWWGSFFRITLPQAVDRRNSPRTIASQPIQYVTATAKAAEPPEKATSPQAGPNSMNKDESDQSNNSFGPGMVLSNGSSTNELLTNSGIAVVDRAGNQYVTVSSHGFNDGTVDVYHPHAAGNIIGTIVRHLPGQDVSLMKLKSGLSYSKRSLGKEVDEARYVVNSSDKGGLLLGTEVHTAGGNRRGLLAAKGVKFSGDPIKPKHCDIGWYWFGNGGPDLTEECRGTAVISDATGEVVGLLDQIVDKKLGWASVVAVSMLRKEGLQSTEMK